MIDTLVFLESEYMQVIVYGYPSPRSSLRPSAILDFSAGGGGAGVAARLCDTILLFLWWYFSFL